MADIQIEIPGAQFRRFYLLYVIEILHEQERFYYVGQTGDNNYVTARPPFRRLAGHFEDIGRSTQNQVYRSIAVDILGHEEARTNKVAFSEQIKQDVEDFLVGSSITMQIYRVCPFEPDVSREGHRTIVRSVVCLEQYVIEAFRAAGRDLMNKKLHRPKIACPYPDVLSRVRGDFAV